MPLGLADVLVQQLGALDVQEVGLPHVRVAVPAHRGHLLGQRVGHRLRDQRLPQPGGPYSRMPFGGRSSYSRNRSECRNGSSTASRICSICRQATRCRRSRCRDLFDELLDLALRDPLVDVARPRLQQQGVADPQRLARQRVGEEDHRSSSVCPMTRARRHAVDRLQQLLEHDDVTGTLVERAHDDVHRLVEHDLLTGPRGPRPRRSGRAYPQLAAAVKMSTVPSSCRFRKMPYPDGAAEAVDLLLERGPAAHGPPAGCRRACRCARRGTPHAPRPRRSAPRGRAPAAGCRPPRRRSPISSSR